MNELAAKEFFFYLPISTSFNSINPTQLYFQNQILVPS